MSSDSICVGASESYVFNSENIAGSTWVVFVIDQSGSMSGLREDTVGGYNNLIEEQKKTPGKVSITTVFFNHVINEICVGIDINEVNPLKQKDYAPMGSTALYDAIGYTIDAVQTKIDDTNPIDRPKNVLFVIMTDGEENSSIRYKKDEIVKMITHQQNGHGWEFVFCGADVNAFKEAEALNIHQSANWGGTARGMSAAYSAINDALYTSKTTGTMSTDTFNNISG